MTDVGSWTPAASELGETHREALSRVGESALAEQFSVEGDDRELVRQFMTATKSAIASFIEGIDSETLIVWIRVATRAEAMPGCDAGDKSPVIAMARLLRDRGDYPDTLTAWIRAQSNNRFLPYGSLMDRL